MRHPRRHANDDDDVGGVVPLHANLPANRGDLIAQPMEIPGESEFAGINKFLELLSRRRWIIAGVLVLGLVFAFVQALRSTPLYRATATIEVQRQETQIIEGSSVEPTTVADAEHMATQNELLRSRSLAERTVELLDLANKPGYSDPTADRATRLNQATDAVLSSLSVGPVARSRVIKVSVVSSNPQDAADIVNKLTEGFIEVNLERKYNTTSYARTFLEERIATTKAALEDSERRIAAYAERNAILEMGESGSSMSLSASSLQSLNGALGEAERERIVAEQRYLEARSSPSASAVVNSETIRELTSRRVELAADLQDLRLKFKPDYPSVVEMQSKLDQIDREIDIARKRVIGALESEYKAALAAEEQIRVRVGELSQQVQDLRTRSIDYNILQREVDTNRSQYEALLQRYKEIAIAGGVGSSQVAVVDSALVPKTPFAPNHRSNFLRAIMLSLALGVGLAFLLEALDDTIKSPEDVRKKLGETLLGVVPKAPGKQKIERLLSDPRSPVNEAFQSMRASLAFSTASGTPKSLIITSSKPAEGKTSAVTALAYAFARTGKTVLIVDADMRKPSFNSEKNASIGLSGLLTTNAHLRPEVVSGAIPGIYLLPGGQVPPNPAELLASERLHELIGEAEDMFDVVLVDCAPVLGFADAPILSSVCQATVFVIESGSVRTTLAQRSMARLREANAVMIGVLLTKLNLRRDGYGYGYGYEYKYGSKYGEEKKGRFGASNEQRRIDMFAGDGEETKETSSSGLRSRLQEEDPNT